MKKYIIIFFLLNQNLILPRQKVNCIVQDHEWINSSDIKKTSWQKTVEQEDLQIEILQRGVNILVSFCQIQIFNKSLFILEQYSRPADITAQTIELRQDALEALWLAQYIKSRCCRFISMYQSSPNVTEFIGNSLCFCAWTYWWDKKSFLAIMRLYRKYHEQAEEKMRSFCLSTQNKIFLDKTIIQ